MNLKSVNEKIAVTFTKRFGSMGMFYLFCVWAFLPFIPEFQRYKDMILYISAGFVQLVALPLIMVGGNVLGAVTEKRDQEQFSAVMEELDLMKKMHQETQEELTLLKEMNKELHRCVRSK